jgi:hypothetical protein
VSHEWQEHRHEMQARLQAARDAIDDALKDVHWGLYDRCDCGHRRADHKRMRNVSAGTEPCAVPSCPCLDFDDSDVQHRHWLREQERQAKQARLKLVEEKDEAA